MREIFKPQTLVARIPYSGRFANVPFVIVTFVSKGFAAVPVTRMPAIC